MRLPKVPSVKVSRRIVPSACNPPPIKSKFLDIVEPPIVSFEPDIINEPVILADPEYEKHLHQHFQHMKPL